jgi:hypothetical protein
MKRAKYWRLTALLAAVFLVQGCRYGMSVKNFPAAQGPKGVMVQVTTEQPFSGELIEVRDTGLVVLTDRTLRLLPYSAIVSSHIDNMSSQYAVRNRRAPNPDARERLRLLSRFPQGLTPDLLQALLATYQQTELAGLTP